ncbi:MAG: hypothetical protein HOP30_00785, partial [Cyclobacteriaceae bacterium]|nr:hypothetical protein [Cyclobacteriaceae bacterium]
MPRKKQAGFIFTEQLGEASLAKVIAHEIGHGAFRLEHTFDTYNTLEKYSTDNLMDYQPNGITLHKYQWDLIHDPAAVLGLFEGDEGGAYSDTEYFTKLLQEIRCAYASGIDQILLPSNYRSGGEEIPVVGFNYGLPLAQTELNSLKIRNAWWTTPSDNDKVVIKNPVIDSSRGTITFGKFKIKVPTASYSNFSPFEHFRKYLFAKDDDVIAEFNAVWEQGIRQKIESNQKISGDDIARLKSIASCASKYLDVESRYRLVEAIMNYRTTEYYEDLLLDILQTTPKGESSKKLFDKINANRSLLISLITSMDNLWGNEKNFDRLAKEYLALFQKGYNVNEQLSIYKTLTGDQKFFYYGFTNNLCEWRIETSRTDEKISFTETEIFDLKLGNYNPNTDGSTLAASCKKEQKSYSVPLQGFVSVNFATASFLAEKHNCVLMPALVYYAMIKGQMNEQLYSSAVIAWTALSIITPYDEFYFLGKALQYGSKGFRALRLSRAMALSKANRIEVPLTNESIELKQVSNGKLDEYV